MKIRLLIVFLLIFPFVVHFSTTSSYACSCIQPESALEELERSDFVFSGKVFDLNDPNSNAMIKSSADLLEIHFEVSNTWKGVDATEVMIYTERDSASCGYNFTINDEYLVYGNENNGKKTVSLCSKTTLLTDASADLQMLGEGQKPSEVVNLVGNHSTNLESSMIIPITIFAIAAIFIIFVSYKVVKKNTGR